MRRRKLPSRARQQAVLLPFHPSTSGFTLIEVLVATLIMAIAVAGLMSAISTSLRNGARLTDHDRAALLGRQKMDELLIASGLQKGVPFQGTWGPEVTGNLNMGWRARVTPFEVPKGATLRMPFLERIELEIWWMNGAQRRAFTLEGFHRAVLTKDDLTAMMSLGSAQGSVFQGVPSQ